MGLLKYMLGLLLFSFAIVSCLFILTDVNDTYNLGLDTSQFNNTYDRINQTYDVSMEVQEKVLNNSIEGADESWESTVKGGYSSIRKVTGTFGFMGAMANDIAKVLSIPQFVITFGFAAIMLIITFAIIWMIFRFRGD